MSDTAPAVPPATVKCLVWDLDNTLWHGTLLEDEDVVLSEAIREVIVGLDARGILQSVCSRNDHEIAWARLEALGVASYFVVPEIGWGPKSDAVRRITEQLNFAPGTIAFIDDQPAERAEVAFHFPEVRCYAAQDAVALLGLPEFSPRSVTVDSRQRRTMYQAGFRRTDERERFAGSSEDFLRSLDMVMRIGRATEDELSRVEELTLRTSQMNATGVHYPDEALRALLACPGHEVLVTTLTDRFGPHGAVGVVLLKKHPGAWHLKLLATSCRVVAFGAGTIILNWLVDQAALAGVHLLADFRASDRNRVMEIAYRFAGFDEQPCDCRDEVAESSGEDVLLLHLTAERRDAPTTARLIAPDLTDRAPAGEGRPD
ncbi:HAD-IIIC family phosphatase [Streptomyces scopuliridis]|uniref:HAD-IIIC family phosphatase n=1 Tax=Streptomyces scopuliridis TaxID=452529 RepID=A0ACD4ZCN3_9ACTN|nr:HAD-IIIC family phosphatase [Streptomyces scopuliridis]WSB31486.1 HAD-IIIC family phosphatase [Streptomyces scopuliridis]WSB95733.1 HAD-IIIC family phosphatase [Streptomyces scopuliridis]WSC10560.1 HAD-IIIC family phosphatase [Streptomyces scopuliridis]